MIPAIVGERDIWDVNQRFTVHFNRSYAARNAARVFYPDFVSRRVITETHGVIRPASRNARVDREHRSAYAETQDPFDSRAIEPSGRPGVPRPAAAPDMRRFGINITCHHIGLHFVPLHGRGGWTWYT